MELWSGILISYHLNLPSIHIYGDSKYTIDGISGRCRMQCSNRVGWIQWIKYLLGKFQAYTIQHIHMEKNMCADLLSKRGLESTYGAIQIMHYRASTLLDSQSFPLP